MSENTEKYVDSLTKIVKNNYKTKYDKIRNKLKQNLSDVEYRDDLLASVYASVEISALNPYMEHYNDFSVTVDKNFVAMITGKVNKEIENETNKDKLKDVFQKPLSSDQISELKTILIEVSKKSTKKTGEDVDFIIKSNLKNIFDLNNEYTNNYTNNIDEINGKLATQYTGMFNIGVKDYPTKQPFIIGKTDKNYIFLENNGRVGNGSSIISVFYEDGGFLTFGHALVRNINGTAKDASDLLFKSGGKTQRRYRTTKKMRKSRSKRSRK